MATSSQGWTDMECVQQPKVDLLVQCLECDNTFRESEEMWLHVCPHCSNPDPRMTEYVQENDNA